MVRKAKTVILTGLAICFYSCNPNANEIPGTYINNQIHKIDTLILDINHQYIHKAKINSILKVQKGTWTYRDGKIILTDYVFLDSKSSQKYIWSGNLEFENNELRININDDIEEYYKKIDVILKK